jgi:hypothetical protein
VLSVLGVVNTSMFGFNWTCHLAHTGLGGGLERDVFYTFLGGYCYPRPLSLYRILNSINAPEGCQRGTHTSLHDTSHSTRHITANGTTAYPV